MISIQRHTLSGLIKHITFIVILLGMLLQPLAETIALCIDSDIEFAQLNNEKESDEKEKLEEDTKTEKIELQVIYEYNRHLGYASSSIRYEAQHLPWDFSIEIPIPPPELL